MIKHTDEAGRVCVIPSVTQRRSMALGRQVLRVLGPIGVRTAGFLASSIPELERLSQEEGAGPVEQFVAIATVVRESVPDDDLDALFERLTDERAETLMLSILDGVTVGGVAIDRKTPETIDLAYEGTVDPWAPFKLAAFVANEYRLFPSPGGSTKDAGQAKDGPPILAVSQGGLESA